MNSRSNWADSNLRVFCLADENDEIESRQNNMRLLMKKLRISIQDVVVIKDTASPTAVTKDWFDSITKNLISRDLALGNNVSSLKYLGDYYYLTYIFLLFVGSNILESERAKTLYHMRLRELLLQHSADANLVVMYVKNYFTFLI